MRKHTIKPADKTRPLSAKKIRLDDYLVSAGLAATKAKAKALIMAGSVRVDDEPATKAGLLLKPDAKVELPDSRDPELKFVGRGGLKLEHALEQFGIDVTNKVAADIGSSTGGFTDCLLKRGAKKVYAVDAGTNQLDWRLRSDQRVIPMENTNARYLTARDIGEKVAFVSIDVSFISVGKILPAITDILEPGGYAVALVKPQFETGRENVGKGGIVKDETVRAGTVAKVAEYATKLGFEVIGSAESPIHGRKGNLEYLIALRFRLLKK